MPAAFDARRGEALKLPKIGRPPPTISRGGFSSKEAGGLAVMAGASSVRGVFAHYFTIAGPCTICQSPD